MNSISAILELTDVTVHPAGGDAGDLHDATLRLEAGECAVVVLEAGNERIPLADVAAGLAVPAKGRVAYRGENWAAMSPDRELACRASIGRVFDGWGWVSNLTVIENVTLGQRHHTRRPVPEIVEEAETLARTFGLAGVPVLRPDRVPQRDLRRAEWVRALLGRPALILLERPTEGVADEDDPLLVAAVEAARARGAAVLWTTVSERVEETQALAGVRRYAMFGPTLVRA